MPNIDANSLIFYTTWLKVMGLLETRIIIAAERQILVFTTVVTIGRK